MDWMKITPTLPPVNLTVEVRDSNGITARGFRWKDYSGNSGWVIHDKNISVVEWRELYKTEEQD